METIEDALTDIDLAFTQVEYTLRASDYWRRDEFEAQEFISDIHIRLPEGDLHFPHGPFAEKSSIIKSAEIAISLAFGTTALMLDQALEIGGYKPKPESEESFDQLRCIVYLVRCAFAHKLAAPIWDARKKKRRIYKLELPQGQVVLDLCSLQGKEFAFEHMGGHRNWFAIRDIVIARLTSDLASLTGSNNPEQIHEQQQ